MPWPGHLLPPGHGSLAPGCWEASSPPPPPRPSWLFPAGGLPSPLPTPSLSAPGPHSRRLSSTFHSPGSSPENHCRGDPRGLPVSPWRRASVAPVSARSAARARGGRAPSRCSPPPEVPLLGTCVSRHPTPDNVWPCGPAPWTPRGVLTAPGAAAGLLLAASVRLPVPPPRSAFPPPLSVAGGPGLAPSLWLSWMVPLRVVVCTFLCDCPFSGLWALERVGHAVGLCLSF